MTNKDTFNPAIDSNYFPNVRSSDYWSSSPYAGADGSAWRVSFGYGYNAYGTRSDSYHVRLVRSGEWRTRSPRYELAILNRSWRRGCSTFYISSSWPCKSASITLSVSMAMLHPMLEKSRNFILEPVMAPLRSWVFINFAAVSNQKNISTAVFVSSRIK